MGLLLDGLTCFIANKIYMIFFLEIHDQESHTVIVFSIINFSLIFLFHTNISLVNPMCISFGCSNNFHFYTKFDFVWGVNRICVPVFEPMFFLCSFPVYPELESRNSITLPSFCPSQVYCLYPWVSIINSYHRSIL